MDWNAASTWGLAARLGAVALLALVTVAAAWRWAQRKHAHGEAEE